MRNKKDKLHRFLCFNVSDIVMTDLILFILYREAGVINVDSYLQIKYLIQLFMQACGVIWLPLDTIWTVFSALCESLCLALHVLDYRVTGDMLVCGIPQYSRGLQLYVMVFISRYKDAHVCMGVSCSGQGLPIIFQPL